MPVTTGVVGDLCMAALVVLAARDMPAERCRAAVLDRRHHFELAEADMAGVGLAPRRSMAAEDIRNLQPWTRQQRRVRLARPWPRCQPPAWSRLWYRPSWAATA